MTKITKPDFKRKAMERTCVVCQSQPVIVSNFDNDIIIEMYCPNYGCPRYQIGFKQSEWGRDNGQSIEDTEAFKRHIIITLFIVSFAFLIVYISMELAK